MFPPFLQELAYHYCQEILNKIEFGEILIKQVARESVERSGQGIMIGCLVCWNKKSEKREILLALSGYAKRFFFTEKNQKYTVVPDIVTADKIENALKEYDAEIHRLTDEINQLSFYIKNQTENQIQKQIQKREDLIKKRTQLTDVSLRRVFDLYEFTTINKTKISLNQIIEKRNGKLPPTGTGDCCAPKLLSYAFENDLIPLSMDEIFYGKDTNTKKNGVSYPPCDSRCGIILPYILGLEIIYRDSQIIVVNKPSNLLSVPGRGEEKKDCVVNRLKTLLHDNTEYIEQPSVHRLDMETSGLLVLALTKEAHADLSSQFEKKLVHKKYIALLDGILEKSEGELAPKKGETEGHIELKFRLDVENRPHQIYDEINGKLGVTDWKKTGTKTLENPVTKEKRKVTRIEFIPYTGRTHQLRLAASSKKGLGVPIVGDSLYGKCDAGERLYLHAYELEFFHPVSGKRMHFVKDPEF